MKYRRIQSTVKKSTARRKGAMKIRIMIPSTHDAMTKSFTRSVANAAAYKRVNNLPIAKYDQQLDRAYLEYPDGRKEYLDEA